MPYRWVDHTAELELHIAADTEAGVFEQALLAFAELVGDGPRGESLSRDVELVGSDRATLLAGWLDELVYRAETEDLVPDRVGRMHLGPDHVAATVRGHRGEPRHLVKGVTYNGLAFARQGAGYAATVVLDV